jgi:hypothetical protein
LLQPPNHRLKKEERQLLASLLKLCCKEADTHHVTPSGDTSATPISDATADSFSTLTNASSKMCQKFNIRTRDKAALVMELVRGMKSPEKVPVRRQLLGGQNVTIQSLNKKDEEIHSHSPVQRWRFCRYDFGEVQSSGSKLLKRLVVVLNHQKGLTLVLFGLGNGWQKQIKMSLPRALRELVSQ